MTTEQEQKINRDGFIIFRLLFDLCVSEEMLCAIDLKTHAGRVLSIQFYQFAYPLAYVENNPNNHEEWYFEITQPDDGQFATDIKKLRDIFGRLRLVEKKR